MIKHTVESVMDYIRNSDDVKFVCLNHKKLRSILNDAKQGDKDAISSAIDINELMMEFKPYIDKQIMYDNELLLFKILHNKE